MVSYEDAKAYGTLVRSIKDESTLGKEWHQQEGYLMEGDYSACVGQWVTVHGTPESGHVERALNGS